MKRSLSGAVLVLVLASCVPAGRLGGLETALAPGGSVEPTFALTVINLDGPQANVLIGGRKVAAIACWDEPLTLTPGAPGLPSLPWTVVILDISRAPVVQTLGTRTETGVGPPDVLVIRKDHLEIGPLATPLVLPAESCPPAPSGEILY